MNSQKILFAAICFPLVLFAQSIKEISKDTSYTIYTAYEKLLHDYPFIKIAAAEINDSISVKENIIYNSNDNRDLCLDIFSPSHKNKVEYPAVILIHGGGWRSGNKSMQHPMAAKLAANNYVAVTAEYRLSPEAKYPAGVLDLKNAVKWIRKHASEYNVDENKIAVFGGRYAGCIARNYKRR